MGDTGEASTDAMVGTRRGMVANRAHVKGISWRRIVLPLAGCFWFCITASLAFTIRLMTRRLFRTKREEDSYPRSDSDSSPPLAPERIIEAGKSEEQDDLDAAEGQEEPSVFLFRFSFQVPEESLNGREEVQGNSPGEDAVPSMTAGMVNEYRFLSERCFSGFLQAPQAMTMCAQESCVDLGGAALESTEELDEGLGGKFSMMKLSQGTDSDDAAEKIICEGGDLSKRHHPDEHELRNTEELDTELSNRLTCSKGEADHGGAACRNWDSDGVIRGNTVQLDGELKSRLSAVKFPRESHAVEGRGGDVVDNTEESDRELTARFLSVKSSNLDVVAAVSDCSGSLSPRTLCKEEPEELGPVIQLDHRSQLQSASLPSETCSPDVACSPPGKGAGGFNSDIASESMSDGYSVKDLDMDLDGDGFLSERDFEPEIDRESLLDLDGEDEGFLKCDQELEHAQLPNLRGFDTGRSMVFGGGNVELAEDASNSTDTNYKTMQNSVGPSVHHDDVLPEGEAELDLRKESGIPSSKSSGINGEQDERSAKAAPSQTTPCDNSETPDGRVNSDRLGEKPGEQAQRSEDPVKVAHSQEDPPHSEVNHLGEPRELSVEETGELESLWEHQDLIDQLKMELRKVRLIGLPTILEESESPKPTEDLKPWKFDARFLHEDPMDELNKFYKSYRERMRKLDILNYQKMYAVGFLQLSDPPDQSMGTQKPFMPAITSLLSQNIWPRRRKSGGDPSEKFVKELQSDLETVYVGQSCLSWEFLRWQYERTRESLDTDRQDGRRYNQVAGEFQQFQVLIQRFLEDEPFQGPRVMNYAKNRCVIRRLLQVAVVREDSSKEKVEGEDAVGSAQLVHAMERSIRIFWEFVNKADKRDDTPMIMRGLIIGSHVALLQGHADRELMLDIQADLQKKEKKLKDVARIGNCLVKRLKKPRDGRCIQEDDLFFSQVDLKLVSRVLRMTRITTDQLVWCRKKLSKITFVDSKLLREPSFLLFPC